MRSAPTSSNGRCWTRSSDDLDDLLQHLDAWAEAIVATSSYPKRVSGMYDLGGGPHFGSGLTIDTAAGLYEHKA